MGNSLDPFVEPVSNYINAENNYDSLDGKMSKNNKNVKKKESVSKKIRNKDWNIEVGEEGDDEYAKAPYKKVKHKVKKHKGVEDISENKKQENMEEWLDRNQNVLYEDLAVWFGTKKKPKGSKQPKGPWVNICRKDKYGNHPPCGRPEATDKAYPKCRAAGVAGKMSDSEKRSACQQKRRAEKSNPKSGTGNKPKLVSYKPRNEIKITEQQLERLIAVLTEQSNEYKWTPLISSTPDKGLSTSTTYSSITPINIKSKFNCLEPEISAAVEYVMASGIDLFYIKYALGVLGRESDYGKIFGKYGVKAAPEYVMNKISETNPEFKIIIQYIAKKFGKDNWVPSMGVAQMTPDIAKKYGINLEDLMSLSGSLLAASKYLIDLYKELSSFFDANQPSKIIYNKQLINNPSSTGNAVLDATIMSYNLGSSKFKKSYCKTNSDEYMGPCNSPNGEFQPFPKDRPNFILKVDKTNVIKNYIPTIKTDTTGKVDKVLNKYIRKSPENVQYISNMGYLKEVVNNVKNFSCIK